MTQPAIAEALEVFRLSTVNRAHMELRSTAASKRSSRSRPRTPAPEHDARRGEGRCWARFAKAAGAGEMLNITILKRAYEQAIGITTSNSTVYNLLHRSRLAQRCASVSSEARCGSQKSV